MQEFWTNWQEFAFILSACIAFSLFLGMSARKSRQRAMELQIVAEALKEHYAAIDELANDPATPPAIVDFVSVLAEGVADPGLCEKIALELTSGEFAKHKSRRPAFMKEMESFRDQRPDLHEAFMRAIKTALVILMYRWPIPAAIFQKMQLQLASDNRRSVQFAGTLAKIFRPGGDDHLDGGPHGNGAVLAT